jgi:uncharacterized membrane protein
MLLAFAIGLAVVSAMLELYITFHHPKIRDTFGKHLWLGVAASLVISLTLGALFGAVGLVALAAGIGSTVITVPIYWVAGQIKKFKDKRKGYGTCSNPILVPARA